MRTVLKSDIVKCLAAAFLIMFTVFALPADANAESSKLSLAIENPSGGETCYYLDKGDVYPGVEFDASTNTITLTNADLGDAFIYYRGEKDLTIALNGASSMEHVGKYGSGIVMSEETGQAGLTIVGPGSLTMTNYTYEGIAQRAGYDEDNPADGNIVIDGAHLNFKNSNGIMSNYSDVIIKNGAYVYIEGTGATSSFGIVTGRSGDGFGSTGTLKISNSDVIIKNCPSTLSYNRIASEGVYFYAGKTDAEYVLDINMNPDRRKSLLDYGYLCVSTTEKALGNAEDTDNTDNKDDASDNTENDGNAEVIENVWLYDDILDYNGENRTPEVIAYNAAGEKLTEGVDFDVECYGESIEPGHHEVNVVFKGKYTGEEVFSFIICPEKCTNVTANLRARTGGYNDVYFDWDASYGADGYMVYYKKASAEDWNGPIKVKGKTYYYKNDLSSGKQYEFAVVPYFSDGEEWYDYEDKAIAEVMTLKKVVLKKFSKSGSKVKVKWNNIGGETGYQISRSSKKYGTYVVYKNVKANSTSKLVKATKGKNYYYKVRAFKTVKVGKTTKKVYGPWSTPKKFRR